MSARLVSINACEPQPETRSARHLELWRAERKAHDDLEKHLLSEGLLTRLVAGGAPPTTEAERLIVAVRHASDARITMLEGRIRQLERTLRLTFESDSLTDDQRISILEVFHGKRGGRRDSRFLSESEEKLVQQYRRIDSVGRQMLRTLFARLAETSSVTSDEEGGNQ